MKKLISILIVATLMFGVFSTTAMALPRGNVMYSPDAYGDYVIGAGGNKYVSVNVDRRSQTDFTVTMKETNRIDNAMRFKLGTDGNYYFNVMSPLYRLIINGKHFDCEYVPYEEACEIEFVEV